MNSPLDQFTFGKTKAAIVLAERLSILNQRYVTAYITMLFSQTNLTVKELRKMENAKSRRHLMILLSKDVRDRIITNPRIPVCIATFANNVAQSKIKEAISGKSYESLP